MSEPGVPPPPPYNPLPPAPPSGTVSPNRSLMIILSYIWILFIVPFLVEKEDAEVQWHAKHGLVIFIAEMVVYVVLWVLSLVLSQVWGVLGCVIGLAQGLVGIGFLVARIMAIVKGVNGQRLIIPGLSEHVSRF